MRLTWLAPFLIVIFSCPKQTQQTTAADHYVHSPYPDAYYNPQMPYPLQFQQYPGSIDYPEKLAQDNNNQTVSPKDVQMLPPPPEYMASSTLSGGLNEPN